MKNTFYSYCLSFYGTGGTSDRGFENAAIDAACFLVSKRHDIPFTGDTADREKVGEILESLGYGK